jgi:4-amino-4-deoxy-L-arabinose transferase-like glycosyltransferase
MASRRAVLFVLLLAAAVRLWGIGFGLPYIVARPDETEVAGPAVGFLSGDLRPPFFEWPTLFTYTAAFLYLLYFFITKPFEHYPTLAAFAESRRESIAPFLYITRVMSAVMGVLTVWWVYRLCRRTFDDTTALVASCFLALAFLHVRDSHFGVTDVAMTALVVLTVLRVMQWRDSGSVRDAAIAGLIGGLAGSTKYNGLGVCVPFAVAAIERVRQPNRAKLVGGCLVFAAALLTGFLGASPYIAIDWPRFVRAVTGVGAHVAEGHGLSLGRGWWYYARVVLPAAIGWPMFIAAIAGIAGLAIVRCRDAAVLFAFPLAYYAIAGRGYTVFARYIIPVIPFLCIAAGWAVVSATRALARSSTPAAAQALAGICAFLVVVPTALQTIMLDRLLTRTDNRIIAARAVTALVTSDTSFFQSGERYGFIPTKIDGREIAHIRSYDRSSERFDPNEPDWLLLQRSPLVLYSAVPDHLESLVRERYRLVRTFPTGSDRAASIYDQQDAFYLPLLGLAGIERPGPAFELYRKDPSR